MYQASMSNIVPTPYHLIVNFQDSGNATFLAYLFREKAEWLARNLTPDQEVECNAIKAKLTLWVEEERQHGPGAALNLDHPKMVQLFREQPWVKAKYAAQIANAERLARQRIADQNLSP